MVKAPDMDRDKRGDFNFFSLFDSSFKNAPKETDLYPCAFHKEKVSTKTIYPKRKITDEKLFEKFDLDTLFFIFYF